VAQIEQVWWDVVEFSGCEWVACTVPITHTKAIESTHTALTNLPRFADTLSMLSHVAYSDVLPFHDFTVRWSSMEMERSKKLAFPAHPSEHGLRA
jgi:hypothetical protein